MNYFLHDRLVNYLLRLALFFERPQIFDKDSLANEAVALRQELDDSREHEAKL